MNYDSVQVVKLQGMLETLRTELRESQGRVAAIHAKAKESSDYMTRKLNEGDSSMRAIEIAEAQYPLMEIITNTDQAARDLIASERADEAAKVWLYAKPHMPWRVDKEFADKMIREAEARKEKP